MKLLRSFTRDTYTADRLADKVNGCNKYWTAADFFQVGKGKKWNFLGGEKRKWIGILPEKYTILRVKK